MLLTRLFLLLAGIFLGQGDLCFLNVSLFTKYAVTTFFILV